MGMLPNLHISNFKGFSSLTVERLGRVNLIVGKNNAGKTSLLEALYLYATQGSPTTLLQVLGNRHELRSKPFSRSGKKTQEEYEDPNPAAFARLFHGCYGISEVTSPILVGPVGTPDEALALDFYWDDVTMEFDNQGRVIYGKSHSGNRPALGIRLGNDDRGTMYLDLVGSPDYRRYLRYRWLRRDGSKQAVMVPPNGFEDDRLGVLWDSIAATPLEEDVLGALRLIDSRVERLYFVKDEFSRERTAVLKLADIPGPVPLRTLGDGMNRVLGILLAVAKAKGGIALIDEMENGIHYSVQPAFLRVLFRMASELDVQVFATTHSWDCIEAFQEAAEGDHQEGCLVRLHRQDSVVQATVFDEALLSVVTRQDIEVR